MASKLLETVTVRLAGVCEESLLKMPPYAKRKPDCLSCNEDVLVAENNGVVRGAVSVSHKDILYVPGVWRSAFGQRLEELTRTLSGGWISKLYVLPEYRYQGVGTKLVEAAMRHSREKGFDEVYAGIYVKNEFREVSTDIFRKLGFGRVGSCICSLSDGFCRGVLLKRSLSLVRQS